MTSFPADASLEIARGVEDARELLLSLFQRENPKRAYGIANMDVLEENFPEFTVSSGNTARLAAGVPSRLIYTSSRGKIYSRSDRLFMRESRFLPLELLDPVGDISIVGDTVAFMNVRGGDVTAYTITNAAIAQQMIGVFELLWTMGR